MTTDLSEKASVFLLELVFSARERKKGDLKREYRDPLVRRGFIAVEKRGRTEFLRPTDLAWSWVEEHLDLRLGRTKPTGALTAVLGRLREFLAREGLALADFIQPGRKARSTVPADGASIAGDRRKLFERIRDACLATSGGRSHTRVRLTALRAALPDVDREALDEELVRLSRSGAVALFPLDNRAEITFEDERDALDLSGVPQHLVYLEA
jgi:hypothetical protein